MATRNPSTHPAQLVPIFDRQGYWTLADIRTLPSGKVVAVRAPVTRAVGTVGELLRLARAGADEGRPARGQSTVSGG